MRSQVKPMRSSAPGAKFSTSTSHFLTSASRIAFPFGFLASTVIERLFALSIVKYRLSTPGMSRSWPRVTSPSPARSTLMTSAPSHASSCVQVGPDCTCVKSRTRTPSSALPISETLSSRCRLLLANRALRIELADAAALGAGCRIEHRVDDGRPAGIHRRIDGPLQLFGRRHIHADAAERLDHLVVARVFDEGGDRRIRSGGIKIGSAIDAAVVEDDDADRQVVAADRLDFHSGKSER